MNLIAKAFGYALGVPLLGVLCVMDAADARKRSRTGANKRIDPVELPAEWVEVGS